MPADPHAADIHAGEPAETVVGGIAAAFDTVVHAVAELKLRPSAVEVHRQLGLTDVSVYFPHADTDAVNALGDRFRLSRTAGAEHDRGIFYTRTGLVELDQASAFSLTARCLMPGVDLPAAAAADVDDPLVITGELATVTDLTPARRELVAP